VIVSIIFGCSVQAATPSFQEDLDDFEEIHLVEQTHVLTERFEPLVILWQNEDLAQTLRASNTLVDDIELINISLGHPSSFLIAPIDFNLYFSSFLWTYPSWSFQARAPPLFS